MTLVAGMRLGPYEILRLLGAGGMGAVYSARDTRLQRDVAIKVLAAEQLSDPARRQRFLREARSVSALNHPNIVTLYDVGETGEGSYLVMERVSGRTLDQVIPRDGLRLGETLRLAIQIADALGQAHAVGILHRDLKPANVMVTEEGAAKLLDFGLAKLLQQDDEPFPPGADGSTDTAAGTVLGTVAYMSPEQAQGKPLDTRSDIFSFGTVLYEMATGRRAFQGDSTPAVLAAVIAQEPRSPRELAPDIPPDLERIIQRCLKKDPDRRLHDISDAKVELLELKENSESRPTGAAAGARRRRRHRAALVTAVVAITAGAALLVWRARQAAAPRPTLVQLTSQRQSRRATFSPDGTQIAFASAGEKGGNSGIWLKIVGEDDARQITTNPAVDDFPAWSPDGTRIAFVRHPQLRGPGPVTFFDAGIVHLVSPLGLSERRLSDLPVRLQLSWSPDGRWVAVARARAGDEPPGGIYLIARDTGEPHAVTFPAAPAFDVSPAFSPDGRTLAYARCEGPEFNPACDVRVLPLDAELRPRGPARALTAQRLWILGITWTRDGRSIVYSGTGLWRVRADGSAPPERVDLAGRDAFWPSTAAGRDRLAFDRSVWDPDIYRWQPGRPPTLLLGSTFADYAPQYSPDGRRIAFTSARSGQGWEVWLAEADGSGVTRLTHGPGRNQGSPRWSPDGRAIVFDSEDEGGQADIWVIGADGAGLHRVTHDRAADTRPSWSRDGRLLYFESNRTGRIEIWRTPAAGGPEEQVTRAGGLDPFESWDGKALYYRKPSGSALFARPTDGGEERQVLACVDGWNFAPGPRGIFYVQCQGPAAPDPSLKVLRHWDATTGEDRTLDTVEAPSIWGLTAAPGGRSVLYAPDRGNTDLMMIDGFR